MWTVRSRGYPQACVIIAMSARTVTAAAARRDFDKVLASLKHGPVSITRAGVVAAVIAPPSQSSFGCMGTARVSKAGKSLGIKLT